MTNDLAIRCAEARFRYPGAEGAPTFELELPPLRVGRGTLTACIGPSGSGKTTLLELIAGIRSPSAGRIETLGRCWAELPEAERRRERIQRIGLVFQTFELLEHLSVRENILLPYFVHPALRRTKATEAELAALAENTGLTRHLRKGPSQLSQGERQRVAICRALITRPELLLADEPTGNLDPDTSERVLELMLELVEKMGATLFLVTHDHALLPHFPHVVDLGRSPVPGSEDST